MIQLPDLASMQAKVMINEVDISKIDTVQTATIKLDAYPDSSFKAHVSDVAALARNKERDSKVKIFDVMLLLDESNDKLMPGLTVSCEILVDKITDTLFIPLEALFKDENGTFVYLKDGSDFEPTAIETGQENDDYVIVASGLKENDQIALTDPTLEKFEKEEEKEKKGTL
jgi:multidrug efflux pump subunit AcrA (membrane-fusion protein)